MAKRVRSSSCASTGAKQSCLDQLCGLRLPRTIIRYLHH